MTPEEVREVFSKNLAVLIGPGVNISQLAKDLGINRVQLNRYRFGESWPRPDVLDRICKYFETDARILTTPLRDIDTKES